jgi:hypothetical protein
LGALGQLLAINEASPLRVTNVTKITSQSSSAHKEDLTQHLAWISHKSHKPHLEVKGRGLKDPRKSIFIGVTNTLQRRDEEKTFILSPKN